MRKHLGIIGHKELLRDANSNGIINIDNDSLEKYKKEKNFKLKLSKMIEDYDALKQDVTDIKKLLIEFLGKNK